MRLPLKKVITFISEEYKKDFPPGSPFYQGFDEFKVIDDILSSFDERYHILIKLHPAEDMDKYNKYQKNPAISFVARTDMDSLIVNSDFLIGMGSMLLLEAAVLRRDVVSYRPDQKKTFIGNKLGVTRLVQKKEELKKILRGEERVENASLKHVFDGSTERIINFINAELR